MFIKEIVEITIRLIGIIEKNRQKATEEGINLNLPDDKIAYVLFAVIFNLAFDIFLRSKAKIKEILIMI